MTEQLEGLVVKAQSGFFTVEADDGRGRIVTTIAGRLKQEWQDSALVTVGDHVTFSLHPDGTAIIDAVGERHTVLSRARPAASFRSTAADQEQVLVANLDQVIFVFSIRKPEPSLRKLDRFLVVAEMNELPAVVCVNKVDLAQPGEAEALFGIYEQIGYPVLYVSARSGRGLEQLRALLKDKISVLAGSSGVGKSSLLNAIQPGLGLQVREVSEATEKGMHTTRYAEMFPLDEGGYLADTPGIRSLALFDLEPTEIDAYFREIGPLVAHCQFSDCSHRHEPKCAVRTAVADGRISQRRYKSYLLLREEHEKLDQTAY